MSIIMRLCRTAASFILSFYIIDVIANKVPGFRLAKDFPNAKEISTLEQSCATDSTNLSKIAKFTNLTIFDNRFCASEWITKPAIMLRNPGKKLGKSSSEFVPVSPVNA